MSLNFVLVVIHLINKAHINGKKKNYAVFFILRSVTVQKYYIYVFVGNLSVTVQKYSIYVFVGNFKWIPRCGILFYCLWWSSFDTCSQICNTASTNSFVLRRDPKKNCYSFYYEISFPH